MKYKHDKVKSALIVPAIIHRGSWVAASPNLDGLAMKFYLIVAKGKKQGMPIPISIDLFLIGSDKMCQLRNPNLGLKHCAFVTRDKKVFIRDFDSGEATLVNGTVISPGE